MSLMMTVLPWLIVAGMVAVVGVLFTGVFAMSRGGDFNARYGNLLMRLRVITQGGVVGLMVLYFLLYTFG